VTWRLLALIGVLCWAASQVAWAEPAADIPLSPAGLAILRSVAEPDGILDQAKYDAFWSQAPEDLRASPTVRERLAAHVAAETAAAHDFQRELWTSVKQSMVARREVITEGYRRLRLSQASRPDAIATGDRIIRAAANGTVIHTDTIGVSLHPGRHDYSHDLTSSFGMTRVESILDGLDGIQDRLRRLLAVSWTGPISTIRAYDDGHFRLRSAEIYRRHAGTVTLRGEPRSVVLYNGMEVEMRAPFVGFIDCGKGQVTSEDIRSMTRSLFNMGSANQYGGVTEWRGRTSYEIFTGDPVSERRTHHSIRVIADRSRHGLWIIAASSRRSLPSAKALRAHVEENLLLD
jgi:hypothetical protein